MLEASGLWPYDGKIWIVCLHCAEWLVTESGVTVVLCDGGHTTLSADRWQSDSLTRPIRSCHQVTGLTGGYPGVWGWWCGGMLSGGQCDMCLAVLRYLHFSAHTITSPPTSIVRKDSAAGRPDISRYWYLWYQTDSDKCHWQLAEICLLLPGRIIGDIRWWSSTHAELIKREYY